MLRSASRSSTFEVAADAQEETLRTVVDLMLAQHGDPSGSSSPPKKTFLTPEFAAIIYRVPFVQRRAERLAGRCLGRPMRIRPAILERAHPGFAGVLHRAAFASRTCFGDDSWARRCARSSAACQKVPSPPANVNFKIVLDTSNPVYKTARERLTAHRSNPVCAGCHKFVDPIGLSLENFDGIGAYRTRENDVLIDTSVREAGRHQVRWTGRTRPRDAHARQSGRHVLLVVNRLESYALGRQLTKQDQPVVQELLQSFATSGYRLPEAHAPDRDRRESFYRAAAPPTSGPTEASWTDPGIP